MFEVLIGYSMRLAWTSNGGISRLWGDRGAVSDSYVVSKGHSDHQFEKLDRVIMD